MGPILLILDSQNKINLIKFTSRSMANPTELQMLNQ
jgi:hypothetical protein